MKNNIPKVYSFKRINSEDMSEQILKNSLDFLLIGIKQIEMDPKQSILNFWTGVELFIKAILVEEHWALIVQNTKSINHVNFKNGDFISIDFHHSIELLENLFNIKIDARTRKAFEILRTHRNKIVHFTDPKIIDKKATEICEIFVEISNVWAELKSLKLPVLDINKYEIPNLFSDISNSIENNKIILEGKYQYVYENKLKHIKSQKIRKCPLCNYKSLVLSPINDILLEANCFVCNNEIDLLQINCEHCNTLNYLSKSENICENCKRQINIISYILKKFNLSSKDSVAMCHRCNFKTVIDFGSFGFCINCFSFHEKIYVCASCGSSVTHSTKNSYSEGCICCED